MRRHPVVGSVFLLLGAAFIPLGLFMKGTPPGFGKLPLPPEVVVPFLAWQLATWLILFGVFFLRPRGRRAHGRHARWA